jgi:serine/threonine-protein kinase
MGRLIDSRYRVMERLGHGGMGIVYKVEHQRMGKIAAMKVLHRDLATDREVVRRFRREAEAVSKLTHPNAVQTFDFGTSDGAMYLVMEYVRGEDLGVMLRRDGLLSYKRAAPILIQVCGALAEAHELGIVHRDLKPENLLVHRTKEGRDHVKVLDFGLAKLSEHEENAEVTSRGSIVGTPYYMSPEQIRGEPLDHRSDIYSFGAMMYRALTGEHPFEAQTPVGVLTKHLTTDLVPPRARRPDLDIDPRVEAIVLCAMAKRPQDRYANVDAIRQDLERTYGELFGSQVGHSEGSAPAARSPSSGLPGVGPNATPARLDAPEEPRRDDATGAVARLNREDFDAFERSLRKRSRIRVLVIPLLAASIALGAVTYLRWQKRRPRAAEVEPNNDVEHATLIATLVRGKIGQRLGDNTSDRDFYRVDNPGDDSKRKLTARITAIRNIDLALAIYDTSGKLLAFADNGAIGEPEIVPNLGVRGTAHVVAVLESKEGAQGRGPTENITDEYELKVALALPQSTEEIEPNEVDSDATPIRAGVAVTAYLGRFRDVDRYRFEGSEADYAVEVSGAGSAKIRLRAGDGAAEPTRTLRLRLSPGSFFTVERDDPEPPPGRHPSASAVEEPYTILVR